jgi:hypothetical protein
MTGRRELDVDVQRFLDGRNLLEQRLQGGIEFNIDIERRRSPVEQHRAGAAGQVDPSGSPGLWSQRAHELPDAFGVD